MERRQIVAGDFAARDGNIGGREHETNSVASEEPKRVFEIAVLGIREFVVINGCYGITLLRVKLSTRHSMTSSSVNSCSVPSCDGGYFAKSAEAAVV